MDIEFMDDDDFVTVSEAAEILGCSKTTIKKALKEGRIKSNRGNSQPGMRGYVNTMHLIPISEIKRILGER